MIPAGVIDSLTLVIFVLVTVSVFLPLLVGFMSSRMPIPGRHMNRHRLLAKWYAHLNGYFWKPCPVCHREFGGHEWLGHGRISIDGHVDTVPKWLGHGRLRTDGHVDTVPIETQSGRGWRRSRAICPVCVDRGIGCLAHARLGHVTHPGCEYVAEYQMVRSEGDD